MPMTHAEGETSAEILAAAQVARLTVSKAQLARLHRARAIAMPMVISRGSGGTVSVYPRGTAEQVVRLSRLAARERRLPERAWLSWWLYGGQLSEAAREVMVRV